MTTDILNKPVTTLRTAHYELTDTQKNILCDYLEKYKNLGDFYDNTPVYQKIFQEEIASYIPQDLVENLRSMVTKDGIEVLTVGNLPCDEVIPTHYHVNARAEAKTKISEAVLVGLCSLVGGELQTEESSHQKGYIQQVSPVRDYEAEASGRGQAPLPFHVENVFVKNSPSFLALYCLQGEAGVKTEFIFVRDVISYLSEEDKAQLKRPVFTITSGDGFARKELTNHPVLDDLGHGWTLTRFYEEKHRIYTDDKEAQVSVKALHKAIETVRDNHHNEVELHKGTLLIFSNGMGYKRYAGIMHGRRGTIGQTAPHSGTEVQRWLQRICIALPYEEKG